MEICYGIKVSTTQTTLTDYELGLVDGVAKWVTGRPGIDDFKGGLILDGSLSEVSQEIEISAGGSYGTMSGFSVALVGQVAGVPTWKRIKDLGLKLIQAEIVFYSFRRDTDVDPWEETQDWTGRVADASGDENSFKVRAMDSFRSIHKTLTHGTVDTNNFPSAPSEALGKMVPVAIGRVSKSPLLRVKGSGAKTTLLIKSGVEYQFAACFGGTGDNFIRLKTDGVVFEFQDPRLLGKYASLIGAGTPQTLRIRYVYSTDVSNAPDYYTDIVLAENLVDYSDTFDWESTPSSIPSWFFEVLDLSPTLLISNNAISEIVENETGQPDLSTYDSEEREYEDASQVTLTKSLTDIDSTEHPGFTISSRAATQNGDLINYIGVVPSDVKVVSETTFTGLPSPGASAPYLFDLDESSGSKYALTAGTAHLTASFVIDIYLPESISNLNFDELYVLVDFGHLRDSVSGNVIVTGTCSVYDVYGRQITTDVSSEDIFPSAGITTSETLVRQLPRLYFGEDVNATQDANFYTTKTAFNIAGVIDNSKMLGVYKRVRLTVNLSKPSLMVYTMNLYEVGLVAKRTINVSSETIYANVVGETFGTTWGGRRTAADPILNIADALEHVVRNYDEAPEALDLDSLDALADPSTGTRKDWTVGRTLTEMPNSFDLCREFARFGFFGIVAKADGTRAAKTWIGEASIATHTEGVINTGSLGGRDPTSLANLYNDLQVNYAWNPGSQKYDKFFRITRIDEDEFPDESEFTEIGEAWASGFSLTYTSLGGGLYQIEIETTGAPDFETGDFATVALNAEGYNFTLLELTKVDLTHFTVTVSAAPSSEPSTSGTLTFFRGSKKAWKSYAIGFTNTQYAAAAALWARCHSSWLKYGVIQSLPDDFANCPWFPDVEGDWGLTAANNAALLYLIEGCEWWPFRKDVVSYSLPNTAEYAARELLDRVSLNDQLVTAGEDEVGTVVRRAIVPGNGKDRKDAIEISLMLDPDLD